MKAVGTVLEHVSNHTLSLQVAASILERVMLVPVPSTNLLVSGPYTADYTVVKAKHDRCLIQYTAVNY